CRTMETTMGSRAPGSAGRDVTGPADAVPARTPGSLGKNDQGDPTMWSQLGDTQGPLGMNDHATPIIAQAVKDDLKAKKVMPPADGKSKDEKEDPDVLLLAAVAYGEASDKNVYEEMAAIANVIVRQKDARGVALKTLLGPSSTYAYAASDGNARVN